MDYFIEYRVRAKGKPSYLHREGCTRVGKASQIWWSLSDLEDVRDCPDCIVTGDREAALALRAAREQARQDQIDAQKAARDTKVAAVIAPYEALLERVRTIYPTASLVVDDEWKHHPTPLLHLDAKDAGRVYLNGPYVPSVEEAKKFVALAELLEAFNA